MLPRRQNHELPQRWVEAPVSSKMVATNLKYGENAKSPCERCRSGHSMFGTGTRAVMKAHHLLLTRGAVGRCGGGSQRRYAHPPSREAPGRYGVPPAARIARRREEEVRSMCGGDGI